MLVWLRSLGFHPPHFPRNHSPPLLTPGNNPAYGAEDANEDTIGVLVRLITEKKGEEKVRLSSRSPREASLPLTCVVDGAASFPPILA